MFKCMYNVKTFKIAPNLRNKPLQTLKYKFTNFDILIKVCQIFTEFKSFFAEKIDVTCIGSDYASHKSFLMVTQC